MSDQRCNGCDAWLAAQDVTYVNEGRLCSECAEQVNISRNYERRNTFLDRHGYFDGVPTDERYYDEEVYSEEDDYEDIDLQ